MITPPLLFTLAQAAGPAPVSATPLWVVIAYLGLLLLLGVVSHHFFRGTSSDFFVASRSIGPFMLLMSVFGTTMTAFALVGSTGKAFTDGIGVYGLMASWSGLVHSAVFFLVGIRLWAIGKRGNYLTQCQFFRDRFESPAVGYVLFVVLVLLIVPYILIGILGAGAVMRGMTVGMFPDLFPGIPHPTKPGAMMFVGAVPPWLTGLIICAVVLVYVFFGGVRSTAWANTFQTLVFMITGVIAFWMIAKAMGGPVAASEQVLENSRKHLVREGTIGHWQFFSYCFVPLSVGMFPHLFQHWLTARSARTFRLTVVLHPICIMIVWVPCILIGIWAAGAGIKAPGGNPNALLGKMVADLVHSDILSGLLAAGVLAAIMSSLDSQFMCMSTMFINDVVLRLRRGAPPSDRQLLWLGRGFVCVIVLVIYLLSLVSSQHIFDLGVWCFSGFGALFPIAFAAVYWKRTTKAGVLASVFVTAGAWLYFFRASGWGDESLLLPQLFGSETRPDGVMPVAVLFLICTVTLVLVSLLTRPPQSATLTRFFPGKPDA